MLKRNSINIEENELSSWYGVTGFYLPRTTGELRRFDKLYNDHHFTLSGDELDPNKIFDGIQQVPRKVLSEEFTFEIEPLRMAARGLKDIPIAIRQKMLKNQEHFFNETE